MRRTVLTVLTISLLAVTACGDGTSSTQETATTQPSAAVTTTPAAGDSGGGLEKSNVRVGTIPVGDLLQFWVADSFGYFTDEGLEVEFVAMSGGAAIAPAVESGDLDLGWSNVLSLVLAHDAGFDFTFFSGAAFQGTDHWNHSLLTPADSSVSEVSELAGKTIAVNTLRNINELTLAAILSREGLDIEAVSVTEVPYPEMASALAQSRVDAAIVAEPFVTIATGDGSTSVILDEPYGVWGERIPTAATFSTRTWLDANPNTAAAVHRALARATEFINNDMEAAAATLPDYTSMSAELASTIIHPLFVEAVSAADLEPWIQGAVEFGYLDAAFDPAELLWP